MRQAEVRTTISVPTQATRPNNKQTRLREHSGKQKFMMLEKVKIKIQEARSQKAGAEVNKVKKNWKQRGTQP